MRIFKTKWFTRWAEKEGLSDATLLQAIREMAQGLVDANLGGGVYKKRIALPGRGRRGSTRALIAFQVNDKAFFLYGFAKNQQDNINPAELRALKRFASVLLNYDTHKLEQALHSAELTEIEVTENDRLNS